MIKVNYLLRIYILFGNSSPAVLSVFRYKNESRRRLSISAVKKKKAETDAGRNVDLSKFPPDKIRNFSIVAHVDHGKSTLADRMLEITGTISTKSENKQVLDKLRVERERGITVKAQTASIIFKHKEEDYLLNLIDTPGHVDFSYEVSRSLGACQGVVLLVAATQGVQAQTLSNFYLTMEKDLKVIPVINKIDIKSANIEGVSSEMERFLDIPKEDIILVSAKTGLNISLILEAIVDRLPSPSQHYDDCDSNRPLRGLLFDSSYESYRGVNANIALSSGSIKTGDRITTPFLSSSKSSKGSYEVKEVGILWPEFYPTGVLYAGQVGYMFCGMKSTAEARIGDTVYRVGSPVDPFPGFSPAKPMVFGTLFPAQQSDFVSLKKAIEKLTLNDSSVTVQSATTAALGAGFRLGFHGLLHMDVFQQRLEQEYDEVVICTSPTVPYKAVLSSERAIKLHGSKEIIIKSPADFPEMHHVEKYLQPMVNGTIITPVKFQNKILDLCMKKDGIENNITYIDNNRVILEYKLPLNEIIVDFNDKLKTMTSGFGRFYDSLFVCMDIRKLDLWEIVEIFVIGLHKNLPLNSIANSFDYEDAGYEEANLVKVDILINDVLVPELSAVFNVMKAVEMGRRVCLKLKEAIPKQLFAVVVQAAVGKKIIARETINALRKDVVAKCYGGDITRRMKLLQNQREGKKRMRRIGKVEVPKEAFIKVLQD